MLFVGALAPTGPLRAELPGVPFPSFGGRTPLVFWLSRITRGCARRPRGGPSCEGASTAPLYNELTAIAPLADALFVPGLWATSKRSVRIGRRYGMPKDPHAMTFETGECRVPAEPWAHGGRPRAAAVIGSRRLRAEIVVAGRRSLVHARLLPAPASPAHLLERAWRVRFPSGARLVPRVEDAPGLRLAVVVGELALPVPWLPPRLLLLPLGAYLPDLTMRLPPPCDD